MKRDRSPTWLLREPSAGDFGEVYLALLGAEIEAGGADRGAPFLPCEATRRGLLAALGGDFEMYAHALETGDPGESAVEDALEASAQWSARVVEGLYARHRDEPARAAGAARLAQAFFHASLARRLQALGVSTVSRDDVRSIERRLESAEDENVRLVRAARERLELLARMSHDLRTPLNAILGFADVLERGDAGPLSDEQREHVRDIHASGHQLHRTLADVLDLARLESGGLELRPEATSIARVLASVCEGLAEPIRARRIAMRTRIEVGLDVVHLDPARLSQIVRVFASNAVRHGLVGSVVEIEAKYEGASAFRVEVSDRSPGIDRETRQRLFDRGIPERRRRGGAGLGLALAKRLAEAMGGTVGVTSAEGEGSSFHAILPLRAGRDPLPPPREIAGRDPSAPRVLVVDDDDRDQRRIAEPLAAAGIAVDCVASGAQAIDALARRSYDAITLDLLLPDTNGLSVLAALRRSRGTRRLPVVIVSVATERATGGFVVSDVIEKPAAPSEILEALARAGVAAPAAPVLVVDDDERSVRLAAAALSKAGFAVDVAENGAVGLARVAARPPSAVVLDLEMPVLDGFGFLDRFRADPRFAKVPVLVWTVRDLGPYEARELARRAEAVLPKDGRGAEELVLKLRAELGRRDERGG
ncbi:MAG: response regulator [Sandaracinus sp.]